MINKGDDMIPVNISKIYRTSFSWELNNDESDYKEEIYNIIAKYPDCECEIFSGNSACLPFINIESENEESIKRMLSDFEKFFDSISVEVF